MDITQYPVAPPKLVAIATEPGLKPNIKFPDPDLPGPPPQYGDDLTFGTNGIAPNGENVGSTEAELKPKMAHLLDYFTDDDSSGMARRLFNRFLAKQSQVTYFTDQALDKAADAHENMEYFCRAAWGAPWPWGVPPAPGKTRIHQALKAANWDLNALYAPNDLGAPAFDLGEKFSGGGPFGLIPHLGDPTGDWANGLGLMIDAVQYVYVVATQYRYDKDTHWYGIRLKYVGLDVFGLDNDDVNRYGKKKDGAWTKFGDAGIGFTAWWQLQHQHAYAPLITRFVVERTFQSPAE